jgi:type I restriction enzyme M protein
VFEVLMEDCDVHTVLRCPRGTFSPYTEGTNTNALFFTKGPRTESTWIYDGRSNVPKINKKSRPLSSAHFSEFESCYGKDPNGRGDRSEADSIGGRWREFTRAEIERHQYKLDAFRWIQDDDLGSLEDLPEPEVLLAEAVEELQLALVELSGIGALLDDESVEVA